MTAKDLVVENVPCILFYLSQLWSFKLVWLPSLVFMSKLESLIPEVLESRHEVLYIRGSGILGFVWKSLLRQCHSTQPGWVHSSSS